VVQGLQQRAKMVLVALPATDRVIVEGLAHLHGASREDGPAVRVEVQAALVEELFSQLVGLAVAGEGLVDAVFPVQDPGQGEGAQAALQRRRSAV
jgi:hypothetical protein